MSKYLMDPVPAQDEVDGGIVTRREVLAGDPGDDRHWSTSLEQHQKALRTPHRIKPAAIAAFIPPTMKASTKKRVSRVIKIYWKDDMVDVSILNMACDES